MSKSERLPEGMQPQTTGTLIERTEKIIKLYDAEPKDYGFHDSGDANSYAAEMADLLEQWAKAVHNFGPRYEEESKT